MYFKFKKSSMWAESYLHGTLFLVLRIENSKKNKGQIKSFIGFLVTQSMMQHYISNFAKTCYGNTL